MRHRTVGSRHDGSSHRVLRRPPNELRNGLAAQPGMVAGIARDVGRWTLSYDDIATWLRRRAPAYPVGGVRRRSGDRPFGSRARCLHGSGAGQTVTAAVGLGPIAARGVFVLIDGPNEVDSATAQRIAVARAGTRRSERSYWRRIPRLTPSAHDRAVVPAYRGGAVPDSHPVPLTTPDPGGRWKQLRSSPYLGMLRGLGAQMLWACRVVVSLAPPGPPRPGGSGPAQPRRRCGS
jgi:hypothetical protein